MKLAVRVDRILGPLDTYSILLRDGTRRLVKNVILSVDTGGTLQVSDLNGTVKIYAFGAWVSVDRDGS